MTKKAETPRNPRDSTAAVAAGARDRAIQAVNARISALRKRIEQLEEAVKAK